MALPTIGALTDGAHFTRGGAVNDRPDPSPCWCGAPACYDHGGQCDRCGWSRARAMLARVRLSSAQSVVQCIDACEGRGDQYDA